jgi:hypothetical protein
MPDRLHDIHNAMICSMIANILRDPQSPAVRPSQFFVLRDEPEPEPEQLSEAQRFKRALSAQE